MLAGGLKGYAFKPLYLEWVAPEKDREAGMKLAKLLGAQRTNDTVNLTKFEGCRSYMLRRAQCISTVP